MQYCSMCGKEIRLYRHSFCVECKKARKKLCDYKRRQKKQKIKQTGSWLLKITLPIAIWECSIAFNQMLDCKTCKDYKLCEFLIKEAK